MPTKDGQQVNRVLQAATDGDVEAGRALLPLVYKELKALARQRMKMLPPGQTLQPTALGISVSTVVRE